MEDTRKKNIAELTNCTLSEYKQLKKLPIKLMADNVRSMYNIGSFFRTSDAFMIDEIILAGISATPPHPEISKTALGAELSVDWIHVESALEECKRLQMDGWKVCVLEQTHNSIPLPDFKPDKDTRYLLVVGNEVKGVDQAIVDIADIVLEIPQHGTKHSLNVSTSAAIALYAICN